MFSMKESKGSGASSSDSYLAAPSTPEIPAGATQFAEANRKAVPSILSPDLKIVGNLMSEGDLQVDGTVEGDIKARLLTIGATAQVTGALEAETVRVSGSVTGRIDAKSVVLERNARVEGDIVHESLTMEAGADFEGQVKRRSGAAKPKANGKVTALKSGEESAPAGNGHDAAESLSA
ncbi:MAG TPA: polymer-forming cytoskeletal protein [Kiloniellales bacterium]|nr:polymer-forming cytoskeletal protein [Kiloniellales bacterium]